MTPEGRLLFEARKPLADPGLQGISRRNQEASALRFGDWNYLVCGAWDKDIAPGGKDRVSCKIAHVNRMGQTSDREDGASGDDRFSADTCEWPGLAVLQSY